MAASLDIFRALADPTRLRIFHLLRTMELAVGEVAQVMEQSQPRVSRHIRILVEAELVDRRKEGSWVFLMPGQGEEARAMLDWFDRITPQDEEQLWIAADRARLAAVRADRAAAASQYFADHAGEWDAIRSLHVPEAEVEGAMARLLGDRPIGRLLDVGTGTGRMVELFGGAASAVVAVDRSPDMLRLARAKLPTDDPGKYRLTIGDFNALPLDDGSADTIILHQVLHYAQAPEAVIAELARVLSADGVVVIADFAAHDREELRSQAAHARLGFSDEQMAGWFRQNGLALTAVETLSGDALTVKIWKGGQQESNVRALRNLGTSR
ncbi:metalloregulator ArsR/SmtB family transcription factor [Sphingobium sufflavum]|uniref:ArsR/SmtB family transcription factor n=1 Tax=Sphingobium sufflavum TaxID=1129547 RepID=UPI001F43724A|nr:metalloregulator ArsR/SmtB family transcription factor [Sphingobium sufflavum]MCE7796808.1 metalloregulator ArsR/SmtB family transcription factor [Sphingobium sufflavum]